MNKINVKANQYHDDHTSQIVGWGHWFTLFNVFIVIALGSQYFFIADWPPTLMGRVYAILSCIGHFSFLTFIAYLFFIFPFSFFIHSIKWQQILATLVATIGISLLLIDVQVYKLFRVHLNFSLFNLLISSDSGVPYTRWQRLFIFVPAILLIELLFALWSWKKIRTLNKRRKYTKPFIYLFMASFISFHLIHIWADANLYRPINMQRASLPLYSPLTAKHLLSKYGLIDENTYQTKLQELGNPFAVNIEYPIGEINYNKQDHAPYNILLINVQNWYSPLQHNNSIENQASLFVYTPKLKISAQEGTIFNNHFSSSTLSRLGAFSLYYGLDPNYYNSILMNKRPSVMISAAMDNGYKLGMFSSNAFNDLLYKDAMLAHVETNKKRLSPKALSMNWITWYDSLQKESNRLNESDENEEKNTKIEETLPWFSLIEFSPESTSFNQSRMINYMKSSDEAIQTILNRLKQSGELNNTVVIITSSNRWLMNQKGEFYDRERLRVPLIILWPDKDKIELNYLTTHVDVSATMIQNLFHATNAIRTYSNGENLFNSEHRNWMIAGDEKRIAGLYPNMSIVVNSDGEYFVYSLDNQLMNNNKLTLSTFLEFMSENRHFMVNY